jgi:phage terminase large subunit-like protein
VEDTHCYESGGVIHHNSGKSTAGAYETAVHLTGMYPKWWEGRKFKSAIKAWVVGETNKVTRDVLQEKLLGKPGEFGTGMIPGDSIVRTTAKAGIPDAVDSVTVKHASGGTSRLTFKSYQEGRESFQGDAIEICHMDEECPESIYDEALMRLMTTNGLMYLTFTPLSGLTELVLRFLPGGQLPEEDTGRWVVLVGWDETPHLSDAAKAEYLASIPLYQRDARTKGIPQLGSGAIYPIPESDIKVPRFQIPDTWPRAFGLDVGFNRTACIWGARDPESKVIYLFDEHYMGKEEPSIHAAAIRARGAYIPGVIDPASRGRSQHDGRQLIQDYRDLGLNLEPADNAVESGLFEVWQLLSGGMLKVFDNLSNWLTEFRLYRRDEKGHVVKRTDHLMDATRYLIKSGRDRMRTAPSKDKPKYRAMDFSDLKSAWMQ